MLKARGWPSLCVEHTERQDRCPQSLREGQRLAEAAWKKGPGATSSAHVLEGARAPPRAAWLRVLPAGACWGWYWRWCSSAWESSPQRRRARAKSTAAEGRRRPLGLPERFPWSMTQTVAGRNGAAWRREHLRGSEQSATVRHAAGMERQPGQPVLTERLHANTNAWNGN